MADETPTFLATSPSVSMRRVLLVGAASRRQEAIDSIATPSISNLPVQLALISILLCMTRRYLKMPAAQVDDLMQVLASFEANHGSPPFNGDAHLHDSIDLIPHNVPWQSLTLRHPDYEMNLDNPDVPPWKRAEFDVWFRDPCELVKNQLSNPAFAGSIDYAPRQVFDKHSQHMWTDLMTSNWSWNQCNTLADDGDCHGAMSVLIILGSDKTTVSVATGQNDYYPLYISTGNLHNNIH
ncbi:hypothetical protein F4604DRAFT_1677620 [Suillus subluteus]|nr:hypothetical protein F4604DRAFT_1677620 [Suillus subluteus]